MLAYYLHDISPWALRLTDTVGVRWYGLAYVLGFLAGFLLLKRLAERGIGQLKAAEIGDFITYAAIFGVMLGGRLGFMLLYDFNHFIREPWSFFLVWEGGMASHGGIVGLTVFTYFYARRKGYDWAGIGDNLVAVAPLGVCFGRLANFINGELYGKPWPGGWIAVQFPSEMERPRIWADVARRLPNYSNPQEVSEALRKPEVATVLRQVLTPRYPSQLFQAAMEGLALFAILYFIRVRFPRLGYGILTGLFFAGYATFRILGEVFREPDFGSGLILGLQKGQFFSVFLYALAGAFLWYGFTKGREAVLKKAKP